MLATAATFQQKYGSEIDKIINVNEITPNEKNKKLIDKRRREQFKRK